jgi:hypothetical protein
MVEIVSIRVPHHLIAGEVRPLHTAGSRLPPLRSLAVAHIGAYLLLPRIILAWCGKG